MTTAATTPSALPLSPILSTTSSTNGGENDTITNNSMLTRGKGMGMGKGKSRFHFHSDTKAPVELKLIEKETHKKQTEFRKRVNDLDHQIAAWMSRFANEILERDCETVSLYEEHVCDPLERCAERFVRRMEMEFGNLHGNNCYSNGAGDGDDGSSSDSFSANQEGDGEEEGSGHGHGHGEDHGSVGGSSGAEDADANATYTTSVTHTASATDTTNPSPRQPSIGMTRLGGGGKQHDHGYDYGQTERDENSNGDRDHDDDEDDNSASADLGKNSNLQSISDDISKLSSNLMRHVHVTTPSLREEHIDSFHRTLQEQIPPKLHLERTKACKREQAIFQKFESMAGLACRSLAEENATRVAQLQLLEQKILEAGGWDERRSTRFMDEIREIRGMLEKERQERIESDQAVLDAIVRTRTLLHKTLLESVSGGE